MQVVEPKTFSTMPIGKSFVFSVIIYLFTPVLLVKITLFKVLHFV
jgi:hypothetical protein